MRIRLAAMFCAVLFMGCSSNTPTQPVDVKGESAVATGRDACVFLTLEDVQKIYGPTIKKSEENRAFSGPSNEVSLCTYAGGEPLVLATMMATWSITANPMSSRDAYVAAAEKDIPADLRKELAVEKVDFQGLPALWQAGQLKVFKEGVMLSILADAAPGKTAKETMEAFMATAVGRV